MEKQDNTGIKSQLSNEARRLHVLVNGGESSTALFYELWMTLFTFRSEKKRRECPGKDSKVTIVHRLINTVEQYTCFKVSLEDA